MNGRLLVVTCLAAVSVLGFALFRWAHPFVNQNPAITQASASWVGGGGTISEILNGPVRTDAIVEGTFTSESRARKDQDGMEATDFSFEVKKMLYGRTHGSTISIHQTGGPDFQIEDDPLFKVGIPTF